MNLRRRPVTTAISTSLTIAAVGCLGAHRASADLSADTSLDRRLEDRDITESSGLSRSTYARAVLWTHNDKGDSNRIFAVDRSGATVAELRIRGARAEDWEDIAAGPDHTLWIGDIGDNAVERESITVHRISEPRRLESGRVKTTTYELTYPDGAHNAEGLMVKPRNGRVYVVTKVADGGAVYRAPRHLSTSAMNHLVKIRDAPHTVTAAAWRPGGGFVLANYDTVYVYETLRGPAETLAKPPLRRGESAEVNRQDGALYLGSEGTDSPVYRVPLP